MASISVRIQSHVVLTWIFNQFSISQRIIISHILRLMLVWFWVQLIDYTSQESDVLVKVWYHTDYWLSSYTFYSQLVINVYYYSYTNNQVILYILSAKSTKWSEVTWKYFLMGSLRSDQHVSIYKEVNEFYLYNYDTMTNETNTNNYII